MKSKMSGLYDMKFRKFRKEKFISNFSFIK